MKPTALGTSPRRGSTKRGKEIELILRLWQEPRVDFKGEYYSSKGAILEPKPVQKPHPPLLFGGSERRMLKLAGRFADICYAPPWNKMKHEDARKIVLEAADKHRRRDRIEFAYAYTPLGPYQHYNREEYGKNVKNTAENGFDYFITAFNMDLAPWEATPQSIRSASESYLKNLQDFATSFISSYNK